MLPWKHSYIFWVCVAVWVIQHAERMRRVVLSSVACLFCHIFPHHLTNGTIFGKKLLKAKCVFWFFLHWNISDSKKNSSSYYHKCKLHKSSCKVPVIDISSSGTQIWNFMKICTVGAGFFHADRQTDTTKLIVAVRNSANAHKNWLLWLLVNECGG
jgi:hypothetical protein